jgi:hypothetical protein
MANADIKQAVTSRAPACTKLQLIKAAPSHLRSVQKQPERIRRYFQHRSVKYAALLKFMNAGSIFLDRHLVDYITNGNFLGAWIIMKFHFIVFIDNKQGAKEPRF